VSGLLAGRSAVVTGASRGIGLAIATRLIDAGVRVVLIGRDAAALSNHADALGSLAEALVCDLGDEAAVAHGVRSILGDLDGPPDILVNNAGAFSIASLDTMEPADFERTIDVNLIAPFRLLRAFLPVMRTRGEGHIVTIGSIADRQIFPENGAYGASKFGVRAMHEVLRHESRGSGVRATLVSPGPVDTPLWDTIEPDNRPGFTPRAEMLDADAVADAVLYAVTRPPFVNIDELRLSRS
jgi:NADP-dependent 3-hydroxy acid dehydrogenase YdfG